MTEIEYGPLRTVKVPSIVDMTTQWWMYANHGPLRYITLSDHRTECGKIISAGTSVGAQRTNDAVILTTDDYRKIVLPRETVVVGAPLGRTVVLCA